MALTHGFKQPLRIKDHSFIRTSGTFIKTHPIIFTMIMKSLSLLFLIIPIVCLSQQPDQKDRKPLNLKISTFFVFENQGYQEEASDDPWATYYVMDKTGPSYNYGANFQLSNRVFSNFELDYGLGVSITSHNFDYSLSYSSSSDYIGFANEKNHGYYITSPVSLYYHKKQSKNFFFSPGIVIRPQFLLFKNSEITPYNYVYNFLYSPGSDFKTFVPKVTLDLSMGFRINEKLNLLTGFIIENNPKYYDESKSEIFFLPISIGFKIAVSLTNL
jgi:hypothetical protein